MIYFLTVSAAAVSPCLEKGRRVVSAHYLAGVRAGLSHPNPRPDPHTQPSRRNARLVRADSKGVCSYPASVHKETPEINSVGDLGSGPHLENANCMTPLGQNWELLPKHTSSISYRTRCLWFFTCVSTKATMSPS